MQVKIEKHGDEVLIRLPEELIRQFGWTDETVVSIECQGEAIVVRAEIDQERRRRFLEAMERANARYGNTFRKLAE